MQRIIDDVAKFGWHVVAVVPKAGEQWPEFAFTVGLHKTYNHPELIIFGLPMKVAHGIFSTCVERIEESEPFLEGQVRQDVLNDYDATFVAVAERFYAEYLGSAIGFYENADFPVLQLVWPDRNGCFPWDSSAAPDLVHSQPVLTDTQA
jgi:hypothetical protein